MGNFKKLIAYQKAYRLALRIFEHTKLFPKEERFLLTDQLRRSSRSVCANIGEAYLRKRYREYFISKLNDAQAENAETQIWLDFAKSFNYLQADVFDELSRENDEVGKLIWYMINNPEKFI